MSGKTFVDTNILLYAHDSEAGEKRQKAAQHLQELWISGHGVLSVQVLQEFFVNATRKLAKPVLVAAAREIVRAYGAWVAREITVTTVLRAIDLSERAQLSFWDSLIIAAASEADAAILLTEDLQHGQTIAGVTICNPFID